MIAFILIVCFVIGWLAGNNHRVSTQDDKAAASLADLKQELADLRKWKADNIGKEAEHA